MKKQMGFAALIALAALHPARSNEASVLHSPIGGALVAQIIGETCTGTLTSAEVAELGSYVDVKVAIEKAKSAEARRYMERLIPELDADYRSSRTCGVGDAELAKDMLLRVRKEVEAER